MHTLKDVKIGQAVQVVKLHGEGPAYFRIPEPKKQYEIANCLSKIDKQIQASQKLADSMDVMKQGLLQQLFV